MVSSSGKKRIWHGLDRDWHPEVDQAITQVVKWYNNDASHPDASPGIILAGGFGCGKTSIAEIIYEAAGGPKPYMVKVVLTDENGKKYEEWRHVREVAKYAEPELLESIRRSYSGNGSETSIISICRTANILILDDLGAAYVKEESRAWYEDILWRLLDNRNRPDKKTMITTNLRPNELKARMGGRAHSRLKGLVRPGFFCLMFGVPDYREKDWLTGGPARKLELDSEDELTPPGPGVVEEETPDLPEINEKIDQVVRSFHVNVKKNGVKG